MSILYELFDDVKFIIGFRTEKMKSQKALNAQAPKAGEPAPDFTLSNIEGTETITLSDFRGEKPVALVFGSYT